MEFLIINDNKLKIMLNGSEVECYGIDEESSDYRDPRVRRAFWKILDRAKEECGFSVTGEKLLIQYYPSKSGAEIFVTKLGKLSLGTERTLSGADSVAMLSSRNMIYRFENTDVLRRLSRELVRRASDSGADAYLCDDGYYYLFFEERSEGGSVSPFTLIGEFGEEIPQNMDSYIKEHSEPVAIGNAFAKLSSLPN